MGERIYFADKETLDKTHANTEAILAAVEGDDGKHKNHIRLGIKIDKNNSNPKTRVEYLYVGPYDILMCFCLILT